MIQEEAVVNRLLDSAQVAEACLTGRAGSYVDFRVAFGISKPVFHMCFPA